MGMAPAYFVCTLLINYVTDCLRNIAGRTGDMCDGPGLCLHGGTLGAAGLQSSTGGFVCVLTDGHDVRVTSGTNYNKKWVWPMRERACLCAKEA